MFSLFKKLLVFVLAHLLLTPLNNTSQSIHLLIKIQVNSLPYITNDFIGIYLQGGEKDVVTIFLPENFINSV